MVRKAKLRCQVITPDRELFDVETTSVVFPAHDGQIGVLDNRAPLLCKMGIGILKIDGEAGPQRYFVDGGFAQMLDNRLTVLTQEARRADEIDAGDAERALAEARSQAAPDPESQARRRRDIERATAQLKLVRG